MTAEEDEHSEIRKFVPTPSIATLCPRGIPIDGWLESSESTPAINIPDFHSEYPAQCADQQKVNKVVQSSYMTRVDRRSRPLKAFLQAEILGADVTIEQVRTACGLTRASYYGEPSGTGRGSADDFPNSEELRRVAEHYELGDNGWVSLLVEFGWLEPLPGTLRMPFTASDNGTGEQPSRRIGLVAIRDALSRYRHGSVLMVSSDGDQVNLLPLDQALEQQPDASVIMFGAQSGAES